MHIILTVVNSFQCAYGVNPDASDERVPLTQWNNCAYVISSLGKMYNIIALYFFELSLYVSILENNARRQDKFLLSADTLTSRQFNVVRSLVRLGSESRIRPELSVQAKQLQFLLNCMYNSIVLYFVIKLCFCTIGFLLEEPAFPELPSILDLNCFLMFVNLHFSISALFISLSSPYGRHAPLEGDPVILQLMGLTSAQLIRLTASAHVLQFLLTYTAVGLSSSGV